RHALPVRDEREAVGPFQHLAHLWVRERPHEGDTARDAQLGGEPPGGVERRPLADEPARERRAGGLQPRERLEQHVVALDRREARDRDEHRLGPGGPSAGRLAPRPPPPGHPEPPPPGAPAPPPPRPPPPRGPPRA